MNSQKLITEWIKQLCTFYLSIFKDLIGKECSWAIHNRNYVFLLFIKKVSGTKYTMWKLSDSTGYEYPGRFICYVDSCWKQKMFYKEHGNKSFNKRNNLMLIEAIQDYIYIFNKWCRWQFCCLWWLFPRMIQELA